ncbi:LysR substrate-binding domain-containing protein [Halomonas elongata]|uniref:LysR family transcriptional regulator n=1 Tax=Halomonas elongata TaxID=2746 RepID=UPI00186B6623|nr:LysR family transcriptional regulator [Halomonas elongata]MBW5799180.1 LysR family transcriptional regulator [Halomonas elongata]MDL4861737.1 LysR substrate-binding domain-containing protein [Halomonas elongata]
MRRFDLDLLHALVTVADCGSFTAAASRLCRSQSAVSEQVRKLEAFCEQPLFSRGKRGATLTPAGKRLLAEAHRLLALNDSIYQEVLGKDLEGTLRLAITDYFRPNDITQVLRRLRDRYPRLTLHVDVQPSASIDRIVKDGGCDLGVTLSPLTDNEDIELDSGIELYREPLHWVAEEISLLGTTPLPLVMMPEHCALNRLAKQQLNDVSHPYETAHSATGVAGLQIALSAGLGVGCLNASSVPETLVRLDNNLPALPEVAFALQTTPSATPFILEARDILTDVLRQA